MGHFFYTPVHQTEVEVLLQDSGRLQCKSALLTRAGEDLGVRKENQDSALALREYRTGDEALFGVFDGHGPNGETVVTSLYPHSVNIPLRAINLWRQPYASLVQIPVCHCEIRKAPVSMKSAAAGPSALLCLQGT